MHDTDESRLSAAALARLPAHVARPRYRRDAEPIGVVHLGVGNFHRAHQAVHLDDAMNRGEPGWAILGVSLRQPGVRDALAPQDGLYSLLERAGDATGLSTRTRVIGALRALQVAPEDPSRVVQAIAAPATRWVTLTITEKGYALEPAGGRLDLAAPGIVADLGDALAPRSAIGLLAAGLAMRFERAAAGISVLSCDNLADNGPRLAAAVRRFIEAAAGRGGWPAAARSDALLRWIDREVRFPASMVDRIVPATTDAVREEAARLLGCRDAWPVATEPFSQWVVQDRFAASGRPALERSGVQLVDDVAAWEAMKLRLLNAAHSGLAYLGAVAGIETVDAAVGTPALAQFIDRFWADEAVPGLPPSVRGEAPAYLVRLRSRFANAALAHRTRQIAMDGSQKLPVRVLPTLRDALAQGRGIDAAATILAGWIRYLAGTDEGGRSHPVDDPLAPRLRPLAAPQQPRAERVAAVLGVAEVFGDLGTVPAVRAAVQAALDRIETKGVLAALAGVAT